MVNSDDVMIVKFYVFEIIYVKEKIPVEIRYQRRSQKTTTMKVLSTEKLTQKYISSFVNAFLISTKIVMLKLFHQDNKTKNSKIINWLRP